VYLEKHVSKIFIRLESALFPDQRRPTRNGGRTRFLPLSRVIRPFETDKRVFRRRFGNDAESTTYLSENVYYRNVLEIGDEDDRVDGPVVDPH